jgi:hypothetical protein
MKTVTNRRLIKPIVSKINLAVAKFDMNRIAATDGSQGETVVAVLWRRSAFHSEKYRESVENDLLSYIFEKKSCPGYYA